MELGYVATRTPKEKPDLAPKNLWKDMLVTGSVKDVVAPLLRRSKFVIGRPNAVKPLFSKANNAVPAYRLILPILTLKGWMKDWKYR